MVVVSFTATAEAQMTLRDEKKAQNIREMYICSSTVCSLIKAKFRSRAFTCGNI